MGGLGCAAKWCELFDFQFELMTVPAKLIRTCDSEPKFLLDNLRGVYIIYLISKWGVWKQIRVAQASSWLRPCSSLKTILSQSVSLLFLAHETLCCMCIFLSMEIFFTTLCRYPLLRNSFFTVSCDTLYSRS